MNNKIMFQERIVEGVCKDPISFDERCFFSLETRELIKNLPKDLENRFLILKSKHILLPGEFICVNTETFFVYATDSHGIKPFNETRGYIGGPYCGKYKLAPQKTKEISSIFVKVKNIIAEIIPCDKNTITRKTSFNHDLNVNMIDIMEILAEVESIYNIEITYEDYKKLETIGDLVNYIHSCVVTKKGKKK